MVRLEMRMELDFNEVKIEQDKIAAAKRALLDLMLAIERHAKRVAPVKTGRLRASIHTEPVMPATEIFVGDGVEYGVFQEFGTSVMKAQPFLRPARDIALKIDLPRILEKHSLK